MAGRRPARGAVSRHAREAGRSASSRDLYGGDRMRSAVTVRVVSRLPRAVPASAGFVIEAGTPPDQPRTRHMKSIRSVDRIMRMKNTGTTYAPSRISLNFFIHPPPKSLSTAAKSPPAASIHFMISSQNRGRTIPASRSCRPAFALRRRNSARSSSRRRSLSSIPAPSGHPLDATGARARGGEPENRRRVLVLLPGGFGGTERVGNRPATARLQRLEQP